jgi:hypothetical protein
MSNFYNNLKQGLAGESLIASWLRKHGFTILPVYEKIIDTGKGPQLFLPGKKLIATDLLVWKQDGIFWIEAKHKTAFSLHRKTNKWVTGIDLHHYEHYQQIHKETPWRVWLMFLHEGGQAKDSPANSPSGLFGNNLQVLSENEHHRHANHGSSGMVYWSHETLKKFASLEDIKEL